MLFCDFSYLCQLLESNDSRLYKKRVLLDFFLKNDSSIVSRFIDLFTFALLPQGKEAVFQLDEKQIIKYIAEYFSLSIETVIFDIKVCGDIGLYYKANGLDNNKNCSFEVIVELILSLAQAQGKNSQEQKKKLLFHLFDQISPVDGCYILRFFLGSFRIGLSDRTILEVLFDIILLHKMTGISKKYLDYLYGICPNLGYIGFLILEKKTTELLSLSPTIGQVVQSQSAEVYLKAKKQLGLDLSQYSMQPKYDGFRLQVHVKEAEVYCFSRNQLLVNHMFPDIIEYIKLYAQENNFSGILDGEVIGFDFEKAEYASFQETAKRKRKQPLPESLIASGAHYIIFDILLFNDQNSMFQPYQKRISYLDSFRENVCIKHVVTLPLLDESFLQEYYELMINKGYEGLMIKSNQSIYEPGKRTTTWLKYKKVQKDSVEDSIDAVVLGYTIAKGKRKERQLIGSILVGIYDELHDNYTTVAQVGAGGNAALWNTLLEELQKNIITEVPLNVLINKMHMPDYLVNPVLVVALKADKITASKEHTSGTSLRFPRLLCIRLDKNKKQTNILKID